MRLSILCRAVDDQLMMPTVGRRGDADCLLQCIGPRRGGQKRTLAAFVLRVGRVCEAKSGRTHRQTPYRCSTLTAKDVDSVET